MAAHAALHLPWVVLALFLEHLFCATECGGPNERGRRLIKELRGALYQLTLRGVEPDGVRLDRRIAQGRAASLCAHARNTSDFAYYVNTQEKRNTHIDIDVLPYYALYMTTKRETVYETRWMTMMYLSHWFDGEGETISSSKAVPCHMNARARVRILRRFGNDRVFVETLSGNFRGWLDRGVLDRVSAKDVSHA
jgi:hypothetical protein